MIFEELKTIIQDIYFFLNVNTILPTILVLYRIKTNKNRFSFTTLEFLSMNSFFLLLLTQRIQHEAIEQMNKSFISFMLLPNKQMCMTQYSIILHYFTSYICKTMFLYLNYLNNHKTEVKFIKNRCIVYLFLKTFCFVQ